MDVPQTTVPDVRAVGGPFGAPIQGDSHLENSSVSFTLVPAPGSALALALGGGVVATRRRRSSV